MKNDSNSPFIEEAEFAFSGHLCCAGAKVKFKNVLEVEDYEAKSDKATLSLSEGDTRFL